MAIKACCIHFTTNPVPPLCQAIRKLQGVVRADALFGGPPAVAIVAGDDLTALDRVIDAIAELPDGDQHRASRDPRYPGPDHGGVSPELQRILGRYPLPADVAACE